jgi:hypothetical protein
MATERTARKIASEWHGGQFSAMYAFSSTGTVTETLLNEIDADLKVVTQSPHYSEKDRRKLTRLRKFVLDELAMDTTEIKNDSII